MPTDPTNYPLIRALLKHYPPPAHTTATTWLSHPPILATFAPSLSSTGQLLLFGAPQGVWECCLKVCGLEWGTARGDLEGLFESHEIIQPPLIIGTKSCFMALVYMRGIEACRGAILDLDGAVIGCDEPLTVGFVDEKDLERALVVQKG